jgi:hypothetical protein
VPVAGAAVLGAGMLAAGVTATVAASRSRRLSLVTGPVGDTGEHVAQPAPEANATEPVDGAGAVDGAEAADS